MEGETATARKAVAVEASASLRQEVVLAHRVVEASVNPQEADLARHLEEVLVHLPLLVASANHQEVV